MSVNKLASAAAWFAAAFSFSPAAQAQYCDQGLCGFDYAASLFISGNLTVHETASAASVWDLWGVSSHALAGSHTTQSLDATQPDVSPASIWSQPLAASQFDSTGVQGLWAGNAGWVYTRGQYSVTVQNLFIDPRENTLYADLVTASGTYLHQAFLTSGPYTTSSGTGNAFDSQDQIHGSATAMVLAGTYDSKTYAPLSGAVAILAQGLGVSGRFAAAMPDVPIADVSFSAQYAHGFFDLSQGPLPGTPSVPEPSTYALMASGLVCLGIAARRRRQARAA